MLVFALFYTQVLAVIWFAFYWAKRSNVPALAQWLRVSSRSWGIVLLLLWSIAGIAAQTCQSNGFNSLRECRFFSDDFANLSMMLAFAAFVLAVIFTLATVIIGAIIEDRARR